MKARLLVALAAGLMVGAADPAADLGEVAQPQVIPPGSRWARTDHDGSTYVEEFEDGNWWTTGRGFFAQESYTLHPTASPPRVDTTAAGRMRHGIYRLEGDRLLICVGKYGSEDRPTTFAHRPDAGQYLFILNRLK